MDMNLWSMGFVWPFLYFEVDEFRIMGRMVPNDRSESSVVALIHQAESRICLISPEHKNHMPRTNTIYKGKNKKQKQILIPKPKRASRVLHP